MPTLKELREAREEGGTALVRQRYGKPAAAPPKRPRKPRAQRRPIDDSIARSAHALNATHRGTPELITQRLEVLREVRRLEWEWDRRPTRLLTETLRTYRILVSDLEAKLSELGPEV